MSPPGARRGYWAVRRWIVPSVVIFMLLIGVPAAFGGSSTPAAPHSTGHPAFAAPAASAKSASKNPLAPAQRASAIQPLTSVTGTFYQNDSSVATQVGVGAPCPVASFFSYCYPAATEPSSLTLQNGNIGVAFSVTGNYTQSKYATPCLGDNNSTQYTWALVGWAESADNGSSFGPITYMGNDSCPYYQAIEPSFTENASGAIVGTYVAANSPPLNLSYGTYYEPPVLWYVNRPSDALAFVVSTDNGSSFSSPVIIPTAGVGNIARPAIGVFGQTIYIAYENISNGSTQFTPYYYPSHPVSVNLVVSTNGGLNWTGPYVVPGYNATNYYTATSPSIAVSSTGVLTVVYATNRHCVAYCVAGTPEYGDDIAFVSSTTNGTTWTSQGFVSVDTAIGETSQGIGYSYSGTYMPSQWENTPETSVAYDGAGDLYVVWAGSVNNSIPCYTYGCYPPEYNFFQVYGAVSTNGGASWTNNSIGPAVPHSQDTYYAGSYNPGVSISPSGVEYVTYTLYNQTQGGTACSASTSNYYSDSYSQWITTSTNGLTWTNPVTTGVAHDAYGYDNYQGWKASITFAESGQVVASYALALGYTFQFNGTGYVFNYITALEVAIPWAGPTTNLTISAGGLSTGSPWSISVDGNQFSSTIGTSVVVTNVPLYVPVIVQLPIGTTSVQVGFWAIRAPVTNVPSAIVLFGNTSVSLNYTLYYGISFTFDPLNLAFGYVEFYDFANGTYCEYYVESGTGYYYIGYEPAFPWYVPANSSFTVSNVFLYPYAHYAYIEGGQISYWNGTGSGSFTGRGNAASITMLGPINETMWLTYEADYNISVAPIGLASGSVYSFDWDGVGYSGTAPNNVSLTDVLSGPHQLTGATATSSLAGYEYFGSPVGGNPVVIPNSPVVEIQYALVDTAGSAGTVSFEAQGLTAGTVWHFSFNGTEYSSDTPWINITTLGGTYPTEAFPVVALNGSTGYSPVGVPSYWAVTPGTTYMVTFDYAYRLTVLAGQGGHVTPSAGSSFVLPGTTATYAASVSAGYTFIGWTGSGSGSYTGTSPNAMITVNGPVTETANFAPLPANRFNLTFSQNTIPNGTTWGVELGGSGYSSTNSTLTIPNLYSSTYSGNLGRYSLFVPYAYSNMTNQTRYVPGNYPAEVAVAATGTPVPLTFSTQYFLTLGNTPGGTISAAFGTTVVSTSSWIDASATVQLQASPNTGDSFVGWQGTGTGSYTGGLESTQIAPGGPVSEIAVFEPTYVPPPTAYNVTFTVSGLATGTSWSLVWGTTTYSSTSGSLTIQGVVAGTYHPTIQVAYSPDGTTQYTPVTALLTVPVTGTSNVPLVYKTAYWVALTASGPGGVSVSLGSYSTDKGGWFAAGSTPTINGVPTGNNVFLTWTGTGSGSYSGSQNQTTITVSGPISEVASFAPPRPQSTTVSSIWTEPYVLAGLAIAGLVVGLGVGIALMRARSPKPPSGGSSTESTPSSTSETTSPESGSSSDTWSESGTDTSTPADGGAGDSGGSMGGAQ